MIARLLISQSVNARKELTNEYLTAAGLFAAHPDLLIFPFDSKLGIEQARKIKEHFSLKPYSAKGRGVVLEDASQLTTEAQNALLKTLEELPEDCLFILGSNTDTNLLPTILSRCQIIKIQNPKFKVQNESVDKDIEKIISSTLGEKFESIEKLKDKEEFLKALILYFHQDLIKGNHRNAKFLNELLSAEKWANQNVNIRAILEYLMLVMPTKE